MTNERISFLNGEFLPHKDCFIHIEDRGFQFADGAYEVTLFKNGKLIDGTAHLGRLSRSLRELNIEYNVSIDELTKMQLELFARNQMDEGICYIQVTRGSTKRVPGCPKGIAPTINATVSLGKTLSDEEFERGVSLFTHEDIRWKRCDIKSISLLPSTLLNQKAKDSGVDDMILVRDGVITEATFANAFIVDADNKLITKNADNLVLCGITRNRMIQIAKEKGMIVEERPFGVDELLAAKEVFLTSSSLILRPVTKIDGKIIGEGKAGKIAISLKEAYHKFINQSQ